MEDELLDPQEAKVLANIDEHGCHIMHVAGEGELPPFSYSIGIQRTSGAPEVVVVGLKMPVAHFVLNEYSRQIREGAHFQSVSLHPGFLEGHSVTFRTVDISHYTEFLGWNRWLYGCNDFQVMRIIYPTTTGVWPWASEASDWFKQRQPLLSQPAVPLH